MVDDEKKRRKIDREIDAQEKVVFEVKRVLSKASSKLRDLEWKRAELDYGVRIGAIVKEVDLERIPGKTSGKRSDFRAVPSGRKIRVTTMNVHRCGRPAVWSLLIKKDGTVGQRKAYFGVDWVIDDGKKTKKD